MPAAWVRMKQRTVVSSRPLEAGSCCRLLLPVVGLLLASHLQLTMMRSADQEIIPSIGRKSPQLITCKSLLSLKSSEAGKSEKVVQASDTCVD